MSVIPERIEPCSPRFEVTPIPESGSVSLGGPHQEYHLVKDKDHCSIKPVVQYGFEELANLVAFALFTSARSFYHEKDNMVKEMKSLQKNQTKDQVELPAGNKTMGFANGCTRRNL